MVEYIKIAVFFTLGVYLYDRVYTGSVLIFTLSLIMVLTINAVFKHKFKIKIIILISAMVAGMFLCRYAMCENVKDLYEYKGRYVTVTGRICEIPKHSEGNVQYVVETRNVSHNASDKDIKEKILLTAQSGFKFGNSVTFSGFVESLPKKMNEDGFDFAIYNKKNDVFFKMYSSNVAMADERIRDFTPYALNMYVKNYVSEVIEENYSDDNNAIMKAVLTGNKKEFSDEFSKILTRTGTKRFFYPAYLHVMLFMSVIMLLISGIGRKNRDKVIVFLLIIYALMNFSNAVLVKAAVMIAAITFAKSIFGRMYYPDIVGIVVLVIGVVNPLVFYDAGFIMSVISSILIYYFYDFVYDKLKGITVKYLRRLIALGIICTVGLIPVSTYFMNSVTVYSILFSIIMLPCVTMILVLSPALILMLAVFGTAPFIGQIISLMLFILKYIPILADKLNLTNIILPKPSFLMFIISILLAVAAVKLVKKKKHHAKIALYVAVALTVSVSINQISRLNDVEVTFVNVGQGDGALISAPYQFNVLIDGGGGNAFSDYDPGEKVYLEYLKTKGITKIDSAFVSHYHQDHVQGIIAAMENMRVRNLFLPDNMEEGEWRIMLEDTAAKNDVAVHYILEETLLTYDNGMTIRIIPPTSKTKISDDENDTSYVYYLDYGEFSCVFTGDMSSFAENNLVNAGKVRKADVLKVSHHGSRTATGKEWVKAIAPEYAVISVGEDNTYALPNSETLENLVGAEIFRTDFDGDICITAEKDGSTKIDTFNRR